MYVYYLLNAYADHAHGWIEAHDNDAIIANEWYAGECLWIVPGTVDSNGDSLYPDIAVIPGEN